MSENEHFVLRRDTFRFVLGEHFVLRIITNAFTFAQTGKSGYGFSIDIGYDMNANKNNSERLEISTTARKYVTSLAKCLPC